MNSVNLKHNKKFSKGYLYATTAAILWGCLDVFAKVLLMQGINAEIMAALRSIIAFSGGLCILLLGKKLPIADPLKTIPLLALNGLFGIACFYYLLFYTIQISNVITAVFLLYTAPIFVTLLARFFYREFIDRIKIFGLGLSILGIGFLLGVYNPENIKVSKLAIITGLGSALSYALLSILTKAAQTKLDSSTVITYTLGFGALFLSLISFQNLISVNFSIWVWGILLLMGIVMTLGAMNLYALSLRYIEAGRASITTTVEPLVATLLSIIFLGEGIQMLQGLGSVLIILGIALIQINPIGNRSLREILHKSQNTNEAPPEIDEFGV